MRKTSRSLTLVTANSPRYNAFISYSHAADGKLAPALRQALHSFAKPWNRLRALNIFQDNANLSANPKLWSSITQALSQSDFFILMASPKAVRSPWVIKELEYWLDIRSAESILIVLTDGDIVWDQTIKDFNWQLSTALPECLSNRFSEEPYYVNLSWARTTTDVSLNNPLFRAAVVDIAAPLHKREKNDLIGQDVEEQSRLALMRRWVVFLLTTFLIISIGSATVAIRQRNVAEMHSNEAQQQRDLAISRHLAQKAWHLTETGKDEISMERAATFSIESWRRRKNALATETAVRQLTMLPTSHIKTGDNGWSASLSNDGRYLATVNFATARVLDTKLGNVIAQIKIGGRLFLFRNALTFSDNSQTAAFGGPDGTTHIVRINNDKSRVFTIGYQSRFKNGSEVRSVALSSNGRFLATAHMDATSRMIELDTGKEILKIEHEIGNIDDSICLSSDGQYMAMLSNVNGNVRIQMVETKSQRTIALFHVENGGSVESLSFSPNGSYLAVAMRGGKALLINTNNSDKLTQFTSKGSVQSIAFSPDSQILAIGGSDQTLRLIDTTTATEIAKIQHDAQVFSLAFNHSGSIIATGTDKGVVRLISIKDTKVFAHVYHNITVTSLAFSSDDRYLVIRKYDGDIRTVEIVHPRRLFQIRHNDKVNVMALSPNGRWLATGGRDGISRLVEVPSGREISNIVHNIKNTDPAYSRGVKSIAFSADSQYLATGAGNGDVTVVKTISGAIIARIKPSDDHDPNFKAVLSVAISPDGAFLAIGKENGGINAITALVDIPTAAEKYLFKHDSRIEAVAFSPDGRLLAMKTYTELRLVNLEDKTDLARVTVNPTYAKILAFSPNGRYLVTAGGELNKSGVARIFNVGDGTEAARVVHNDMISAAAFDPFSRYLATASLDGTARLLEIESNKEILSIEHNNRVRALAFSPDGQFLATGGSDNAVILTSILTKSRVFRQVQGSTVSTVTFSPDGRWLATGNADGTARLIETYNGIEIARIAHDAEVNTVEFTPDGRFLATASSDGTAALHWADPQRMFDLLCEKSGRNLSQAEWDDILGYVTPWKPTCNNWRNG